MKNKNILVTGGLGFIGSHFVELLHKNCTDCNIAILDNYSYCVSKNTEELLWDMYKNSSNDLDIIYEDINNFTNVKDYDYIINFAAESHVDNSISDGNPFITSNYTGVYNLLTQLNDKQRFIQIGTDEVYGSLEFTSEPSEEYDTLDPSSIYSCTKAGADLLALSFNRTYNRDIIVTRCTNNFGPRQYSEKFIPVIAYKANNNEQIPVYGKGNNIRQWIYVKDHCEKIYNVLLLGDAGKIYNLAPDEQYHSEISNIEIVEIILTILKKPKRLISYVEDRKGHDLRYSLRDSQYRSMMIQAGQQLEFSETKKTFADDLRYTIMWYKENDKWWSKQSNN
jgi:dTDP-glucose 4,6-dehydratase